MKNFVNRDLVNDLLLRSESEKAKSQARFATDCFTLSLSLSFKVAPFNCFDFLIKFELTASHSFARMRRN